MGLATDAELAAVDSVADAALAAAVAAQADIDGHQALDVFAAIGFVIMSTGVGIKGEVEVPFNCEIVAASIVADIAGNAVVDIWKDTYANFPPVDADSITAAAPLTLTAVLKNRDTTLTGWNKTLNEGDWLRFNVDSASVVSRLTISLKVRRT
jgi:hypothetical protein